MFYIHQIVSAHFCEDKNSFYNKYNKFHSRFLKYQRVIIECEDLRGQSTSCVGWDLDIMLTIKCQ